MRKVAVKQVQHASNSQTQQCFIEIYPVLLRSKGYVCESDAENYFEYHIVKVERNTKTRISMTKVAVCGINIVVWTYVHKSFFVNSNFHVFVYFMASTATKLVQIMIIINIQIEGTILVTK